ncbi:Neuron navigator 3, partial [Varanus komodoensis]
MPVLGVASKLRQPPIGSKPVHTAHPIPNLGTSGPQQYSSKSLELPRAESSMLACQFTLKSACDFGEAKALQGKTKDTEDSKVNFFKKCLKDRLKMCKVLFFALTPSAGMWFRALLTGKPTFVLRIVIVSLSLPISPSTLQIYTDWANHYLAKSGHKRLIKDLQQDIADGVLLAEIIQIIANEKVEDINGCPRSQSQ